MQSDTESSDAFLSGSTVYVSGIRMNVGDGDGYDQACYWKNGSFPALVDAPTDDSLASAVRVSGGSVYIAGNPTYGIAGAGYWKDGVPKALVDGSTTFDVLDNAGTIYAFGYYWVAGPSWVACYWKIDSGGTATRHDLPAAGDGRYLGKGTLDGSDYYLPCAGGYCVFDLDDDSSWFVPLTDALTVRRIKVTSGAVRAVGTNDSGGTGKACLWVDGLVSFVETDASEALDVMEYEGKTYICGSYQIADMYDVACYWVDGVRHQLSEAAGTRAHTILLMP